MTKRPFQQVDVFTDQLGNGNPVAVVFDADDLSDDAMARFANWTNLSETTFVSAPVDPTADYHVRIFTPTEELPFAGHPTIGTCHAWLRKGGTPKQHDKIVQECAVGLVDLKRVDGRLAFATPQLIKSGSLTEAEATAALAALGLQVEQVHDIEWVDNGPRWVGVRVDSVETIRGLRPDLAAVPFNIGALALTGGTPEIEVRAFFAVNGETREDPVTGSLNGSVAQWLLGSGLVQAPYTSSQGTSMGRDGRVSITESDGDIWVGGEAITGIQGTVEL